MVAKTEFDEKIINMIRKNLEEDLDMNLSDWNQYQVIELWVNKSFK